MKELDEEEGQGLGAKVAVSDALQDLVGRLAGRLHEEAEAVVAQARQGFEAQRQKLSQALEQARQEVAELSAQLQRTEIAWHEEKTAHAATRQALADRITEVAQLSERVAGLTTRLAEHEAHVQSLEQKHQHAREALEHYRTSAKDQREQEQRRHEHQVQELQVTLRQANEALAAKNHELVQLNRDNGQWLERHSRLEREMAQARQAADEQRNELEALRLKTAEQEAIKARWAEDTRSLDAVRVELSALREEWTKERERRESAEAEALRADAKLEVLEQLVARMEATETDRSRSVSPSDNQAD
ncbi:Cointegrate resolution protein T [Xanthomonas citri pv. citri]|nr:Cointegrate resolution protein T [Xanthomonas citri pv. citri]